MDDSHLVRFGSFTLDNRRRELLLDGSPVTIGSRAFDLLTALVERRGRLATKDELMAAVWPSSVVDENNLAAQVVAVRKILSADPGLSKCVQTISGRGYRFVADVMLQTAFTATGHTPDPAPGSGSDALSLVVLPFASLNNNADQADFVQGLSHTIATDLSRIAGLLVISPTTAATLDGRGLDARQVSRELSVQYVLAGNMQRVAGQVRINAHLVDGSSGLQVWSELFDGDERDLLAFQDRITGRIANSLGREIFVAAARGGLARNIDANSFDLLMRGIAADNRPQSLESLQQQESLFAQAVALDPQHAEAHARLARAILLQLTQMHAATPHDAQLLARGVKAAETAVALGRENPRAQCAMGLVHVIHGEFERSVIANEAAIALDRNFAIAHNNLGNSLVHLGNGNDALPASETALRLDPRGPQIGAFWTTKGYAHPLLGANEDAVTSFMRAQSANPMLPRAYVGAAVSLALSGKVEAARQATHEVLRLVPHYRLSETMDGSRPTSSSSYRKFFENVLRPGAEKAGLAI
jgi:adenylate cyclase